MTWELALLIMFVPIGIYAVIQTIIGWIEHRKSQNDFELIGGWEACRSTFENNERNE